MILDMTTPDDLVVACNGRISRELFDLRVKRGEPTDDFYMLGSMGCALPLAIGVAMHTPKRVICLVGDGNLLMKLGAIATMRRWAKNNLVVYVLNNGCHESTGGQFTELMKLRQYLPWNINFRCLDVGIDTRLDLGRPTKTAKEITTGFRNKIYV